MAAVGPEHVWVGSNGIFIYETRYFSCSKQLQDHPDVVVDIVPYHDEKFVLFYLYLSAGLFDCFGLIKRVW